MSERFDPYYTWLGIPPHEQPASHYRLLGISLFESNAEVISNAADRLMLHLRAFQSGKRSKESQQLLNEISAARICLLNPEKKAAYDSALRAAQQADELSDAAAALPPAAGNLTKPQLPDSPPPFVAIATGGGRRTAAIAKPASQAGLWLAVASVLLLFVVAGIALLASRPKPPQPMAESRNPSQSSSHRPIEPSRASPPSFAPDSQPSQPSEPTATPPPAVVESPATPMPEPTPTPTPPITPTSTPPAENKPPSELRAARPPDATAVAEAVKEVQAKYAAQYATAKRPEQKVSLARTLRDDAEQASNEPTWQAALLLESQRLAAAGGDLKLAVGALRDRASRFSADLLSECAELLKTANLPASQRSENATLADLASQFLDQAIADDRFDAAEPLRKVASLAYGKLKNIDSVNRLNAMQSELAAMKTEHDKLASALQKLAASPSDPEANLAVGRYQCFYKNDWQRGLPKLILASDFDIAAAARKDTENPTAPSPRAEVAELWWNIGQKQPPAAKRNAFRRAAEWYLLALPGLTGNQHTAALRRIEQGVPLRSDQPTALVKEGLLAYWSFDEGNGRLAQDLTKSRNHALLIGARWTRGVLGAAMQASAANEYAQFLYPATLNQWTISLWVKIDRLQGDAGLVMTTGNAPGQVQLYIRGDGYVQANIVNSGGSNPRLRIEPGAWRHIVVRYGRNDQGATCETFVDGELDNQFTANKDIAPIIGPGRIGGWHDDDPNRAFLGAIDDVRLYGRVLSNPEIAMLVAAGRVGQ
jgi:Concanavalin A-like lectin/glucanases superfamily